MITQRHLFTKAMLIAAFGVSGLVCACSQSKPTPPERLPDDEVEAYREAIAKILPYVTLDDSVFGLSITKDEALKLDVSERYYDRIQQDLDYTNYLIKEEYNSKGIKIDLLEMPLSTELK